MEYQRWDDAKYRRFQELFETLKNNRANVPVETLQSRYADAYKKLTSELSELCDWLILYWFGAVRFLQSENADGTEEFQKRIHEIWSEESSEGGLRDSYKAKLIDELDYDGCLDTAFLIRQRMSDEAFSPYVERNNRKTEKGIYNSVLDATWSRDRGGWYRGNVLLTRQYAPEETEKAS